MTKKIIGLYQLITGVFGAIIILANILSTGLNSGVLPQIIAGVVLYGLLAWTGYGLLNDLKNALKYSRLIQSLQIVSFTIGGTLYKFTASAFIAFGIKNGHFTYGIGLQPIDFAITSVPGNDFVLIIYLVPIILLWGLMKIKS
jgi:hypothetical protein